ncbi:MAG: DUF3160 domain-containing protein [Chloroflexota bacterium]
MKTTLRKIFGIMMAVILVQAACSLPGQGSVTETAPPTEATTAPVSGIYPAAFAEYHLTAVELPDTFAGGGYTLPVDLTQVQGVDSLALDDPKLAMLADNGFVVLTPEAGSYDEFYNVYEAYRYRDNVTVFVTTDSVYHIYHLIFDKMLRDLERDHFIPNLRVLTATMLEASTLQYQQLAGTDLAEPALRNVAFFAIADRLLGLEDPYPPEAAAMVEAELALINAAEMAAISPTWDRPDLPEDMRLIEDYSQYIPRGHYTRSEDLEMYFRSMMWYGRLTFRLQDAFETRRALLLVQALRSAEAPDGRPAVTLWESIYDPTVFIVGKADDLGYHEYGALSDQVFGPQADPLTFADETAFAEFMAASETLPPPQINSMWVWIWQDQEMVTKGFRFMGQRFTLDAYVFEQMIWRNVGTSGDPRNLPTGLDFFSAMGSDEALFILGEMGETEYLNFDMRMEKVRTEIASLEIDSWTQNLYWAWLYSFQPLLEPKGPAFPPFMQTQAWTRKDLHTALGSWTELKHDTILYAKQVLAEMGGGGLDQPPHGYVEPNPEAYARLLALTQMTYDGLEGRGLLTEPTLTNLTNLIEELQFLLDVSLKELNGQALTDDEYWHIHYWGGVLEAMTLAAADTTDPLDRDLSDQRAALVADVATGPSETGGLVVLEEAIGHPAPIIVVLPDAPWRVAVGAVFTYYEFTVPASERMTDETWQAMIEAGTNPPQPDWTRTFIAP